MAPAEEEVGRVAADLIINAFQDHLDKDHLVPTSSGTAAIVESVVIKYPSRYRLEVGFRKPQAIHQVVIGKKAVMLNNTTAMPELRKQTVVPAVYAFTFLLVAKETTDAVAGRASQFVDHTATMSKPWPGTTTAASPASPYGSATRTAASSPSPFGSGTRTRRVPRQPASRRGGRRRERSSNNNPSSRSRQRHDESGSYSESSEEVETVYDEFEDNDNDNIARPDGPRTRPNRFLPFFY